MTDKQKAITRYRESDIEKEEQSPLERLRFFCSLAMSGDDWLDAEMFFDSLALQVRRTVDPGPWSTGTTSDGRQYLESTDFTHDVRLYVDGDFAWHGDKANYAQGLASQLNASAVSTEPICWVRPVTTDPDLGGFQVCREGDGFPVWAHPNGMYAPVSAEPVAWMTHHDEPMLFPTEDEARSYCDDDEQPIPLYAAPVAAPVSADPMGMALEVRTLGNYGKAFDLPGNRRAYTYDHQPGNVEASRLGAACQQAVASSAGDYIDRGLSLLKELQALGFGVFEVDASRWHGAPVAAQAQHLISEVCQESGLPAPLDRAEVLHVLREADRLLPNFTSAEAIGAWREKVRKIGAGEIIDVPAQQPVSGADGMGAAVNAFQIAEAEYSDRMTENGLLFDPALAVEAGLIAASKHLIPIEKTQSSGNPGQLELSRNSGELDERAAFERFSSKNGLNTQKADDLHRSHLVAWMWKAWQARAALAQQDTLQAEVLDMVRMLEANEWADHCGKSELGQRLELAITALQNRISELTKSSSQQDADKIALDEWLTKTRFIQDMMCHLPAKYLGWHRADVMRDLIQGPQQDADKVDAEQWVSVNERLPEIHEWRAGSIAGISDAVLTIDEDDPDTMTVQHLRKGGQGDLTTLYWDHGDSPTHWRPAPSLPGIDAARKEKS